METIEVQEPDVLDLLDTDPVELVEDAWEQDYESRAQEHFGPEEPHDEQDVVEGVEIDMDEVVVP